MLTKWKVFTLEVIYSFGYEVYFLGLKFYRNVELLFSKFGLQSFLQGTSVMDIVNNDTDAAAQCIDYVSYTLLPATCLQLKKGRTCCCHF